MLIVPPAPLPEPTFDPKITVPVLDVLFERLEAPDQIDTVLAVPAPETPLAAAHDITPAVVAVREKPLVPGYASGQV
jgi:hypothetical protein